MAQLQLMVPLFASIRTFAMLKRYQSPTFPKSRSKEEALDVICFVLF